MNLLQHSWGCRLAGPLLWITSAMGSACVIPQNDPVLDPPALILNRPPRILEDQTLGPNGSRILRWGLGPHCLPTTLTYKVTATDPDWCDDLHVAWYLDWDPVAHTGSARVATLPHADPDAGDPPREDDFAITPSQDLTPGTHVLEVLVADDVIQEGTRQINPRDRLMKCFPGTWLLPDGGSGTDQSYYATYAWTIVMTPGDCPVPASQVCL